MHQTGSGDLLADRRFAYAEACLAEGDCRGAAEMAEQALERAPRFAAAWVLLGRAREACHGAGVEAGAPDPALFQAALRAYETARDLDPEDTLGTLVHLRQLSGEAGLPVLSPAYLRALFDGYAGRFERHLVEGLGYCGPALLCAALDAYDAEAPLLVPPPEADCLSHTSRRGGRGVFPPPSAGEGGPCVSRGRERGATLPDNALPSPPLLRRVPSPAKGGGSACVVGTPGETNESGGERIGGPHAPARYAHAIDLGCGTGLMGAALGARVERLTGVDLAPAMLVLARRKGLYTRLVEGAIDAFLAEEPAGSADLCVAADVFIYLGPVEAALAGMARVLRPGGRAAFTVQSHDGAGVVLGPDGRYAQGDAYLAAAADAAGFTDLAVHPAAVRRERGAEVPGRTVIMRKHGG